MQSMAAFELLRDGVNGYIPTTLSTPVAIEALRLVWAGGTFIPPDMLGHGPGEGRSGISPADLDLNVPIELTVRQHAVLGRLRQGKSNKSIGAELGITEGTVKVYVRQIMKKLGASNRTHACYLVQRALPSPLAH
jgi:DNA-binding NarL/FixJ family response regulator